MTSSAGNRQIKSACCVHLCRGVIDPGKEGVLKGDPPPRDTVELAAVLQQRLKGVRLGTAAAAAACEISCLLKQRHKKKSTLKPGDDTKSKRAQFAFMLLPHRRGKVSAAPWLDMQSGRHGAEATSSQEQFAPSLTNIHPVHKQTGTTDQLQQVQGGSPGHDLLADFLGGRMDGDCQGDLQAVLLERLRQHGDGVGHAHRGDGDVARPHADVSVDELR